MFEQEMTPIEKELEAAMRSLSPATPTFQTDAVAWRLGRLSMTRRLRLWQGGAAALAILLGGSVVLGPLGSSVPADAVRIAEVAPPDDVVRSIEYVRLRGEVLNEGVEVLAVSDTSGTVERPRPQRVQPAPSAFKLFFSVGDES